MTTATKCLTLKLAPLKRPWLPERVLRLIGKERLAEWEDQIADFWEREIDGIDQAQLLRALALLYGQAEAKELLRASRSDKVKAVVDGERRRLVHRLVEKVESGVRGPGDRLVAEGLKLEDRPYSEAEVLHEGTTYYHEVDGLICITGVITAHHPDGSASVVTVFPRWISHPFWQYGHRTSEIATNGKKK